MRLVADWPVETLHQALRDSSEELRERVNRSYRHDSYYWHNPYQMQNRRKKFLSKCSQHEATSRVEDASDGFARQAPRSRDVKRS